MKGSDETVKQRRGSRVIRSIDVTEPFYRRFVNDFLFLGIEELADTGCHFSADTPDLLQVKEGCRPDAFDVAEEGQQRLLARGADAGDPVQ